MWRVVYEGDKIAAYWGNERKGVYTLLKEPYCLKCACPGTPTAKCGWHWDDYGFERIYAMGAYLKRNLRQNKEDILSDHIVGLKQYPNYGTPLGLALVECVRQRYSELMKSDLIVPIPLFATELKVAKAPSGVTYNQSVVLSNVVGSNIGIPVEEAVIKTREQKMKGLGRSERKAAVKGLYKIKEAAALGGKSALLVDDVSTSGATVSECSQILLDAGARMVNVLVAGRNTDTRI